MTPPWRHKTCPRIINPEHLSLALLASRQLESAITHVDTGSHRWQGLIILQDAVRGGPNALDKQARIMTEFNGSWEAMEKARAQPL